MATENKRFIILQNEGASSANVVTSQTITVSEDAQIESNKYNEIDRIPSVDLTQSGDGDVSVTASGSVDPQSEAYLGDVNAYYLNRLSKPVDVSGSGFIQTSGSGSRAKYSFVKDTETNAQSRATYNFFNKATQGLERSYNGSTLPVDTYSRPALLALSNGNLLGAYLDNVLPPWAWGYASSLYTDSTHTTQYSAGPSGSGRTSSTLRLRLQTKADRYWSYGVSQTARPYKLNVPDRPVLDVTGHTQVVGVTGCALVQFPDTDEILVLYCGYYGDASRLYRPSFLGVDALTQNVGGTFEDFAGEASVSNEARSYSVINQPDLTASFGSPTVDVEGLDSVHSKPIDMTAQVLPSGRLVVVICFETGLYSLVSDDRGKTFRASQVLDLTFGTDFKQRIATCDSCLTQAGSMVLMVTANGLGDRGYPEAEPSSGDAIPESVISLFVSADGVAWGAEKKLGGGLNQPNYGLIDTGAYPDTSYDDTYNDQSIYALSGSVCNTPDGNILCSLVSLNLGGPGNAQSQQLFQRVLAVDEILQGQSGEDIAPTLPYTIYAVDQALNNSYQRFQVAKYQPSYKQDDAIDSTNHTIVYDYLNNVFSAGVGTVNPGYLGQAYFGSIAPSSTLNTDFRKYGGGPIWSNGPIDVTTVLWRDSVVTMTCGMQETEPLDYPYADVVFGVTNDQTAIASRETWVDVSYSGGFQPVNVRVPTTLRWWAPGFTTQGHAPTNRYPVLSGGATGNDTTWQMGSNAFQVCYTAPRNPYYQSWEQTQSGTHSSTIVSNNEDHRSVFRGLTDSVDADSVNPTANTVFRDYSEVLDATRKALVFPNAQSESLKDSSEPGQYYQTKKSGLSFVSRIVLNVDYGYIYDSSSYLGQTNIGAKVELHDGSSTRIAVELRVGRAQLGPGTDAVAVEVYDTIGAVSLCTLTLVTDHVDGTEPDYNKDQWIEVVWGAVPVDDSETLLTAKVAARQWKRYSDPDWLNDAQHAESESTITTAVPVSGDVERLAFGIFACNAANKVYWNTVQFSRSFLSVEGADLNVWTSTTMPSGEESFREFAHLGQELAMGSVQNFNGGVFSPMSPSRLSVQPQMVDRGIELSFRGRSADGETFDYRAKSNLGTEGVFSLPVKYGWRGIDDTLPFDMLDSSGATIEVNSVPSTEMVFDFGEYGILPESISLFGINTDELCVDFYDDPTTNFNIVNSTGPVLSCMVSSPGGVASRIWDYQCSARSTHTEITYKPNYLWFWENYSVRSDLSVSPGPNDIRPVLNSDENPSRIMFRTGVLTNASAQVPFIPNQFQSTDGESFYLVIYDRELYTSSSTGEDLSDEWYKAQGCRFRHVFKIAGNGGDYLDLTSSVGDKFTLGTGSAGKILVGSMTIISDRVGFNVPDWFSSVKPSDPALTTTAGANRYRYARIRLNGGSYYDPTENYLQLGFCIMGQRIDLSTRDIDWGYSYNLEFGNALTTGLTGQRRRRNNHKPRRIWEASYSPKPSIDIDIKTYDDGTNDINFYQNQKRGYGTISNSQYATNSGQQNMRSKVSWTELVQRVLTLQAGGEVFTLGFDGDNMVNNHGLHNNGIAQYASLRPALSDPSGMVAARLLDYGGATHNVYQNQQQIGNAASTSTAQPGVTHCSTRPIMTVSGLKFSEEL